MTLEQWLNIPGRKHVWHNAPGTKVVGIHDTPDIIPIRPDLWRLEDYRVSSVTGGMIWLMPLPPAHRVVRLTMDLPRETLQ